MEPQDVERNKNSQGSSGSDKNKGTVNTDTSKGFQGSDKSKGSAGDLNKDTRSTATTRSTNSTSGSSQDRNTTRSYSTDRRRTGSDSNESLLSSFGIKKEQLLGLLGAVAGGALLFKAFKGGGSEKKSKSKSKFVDVRTKVTIRRSREELYNYWRNLENLPSFMTHLKEVKEIDNKRSLWTAKLPGGVGTVEWDAEIIQERKNHLLVWRSLPDSEIENSGEVRFEIAPEGEGTIVETNIFYRPPAGEAGSYAAKLLNPAFEKVLKKDLKQFKKIMEKGRKKRLESSSANRPVDFS